MKTNNILQITKTNENLPSDYVRMPQLSLQWSLLYTVEHDHHVIFYPQLCDI